MLLFYIKIKGKKEIYLKIKSLIAVILIISMLPVAVSVSADAYGVLTYTVENDEITITKCETTATQVEIPAEIDSKPVKYIADRAFYNCRKLTEISIPDTVTSIGANAFQYCSVLSSITLPDSIETIGSSAFASCSSLTVVVIPNSVESIGIGAFRSCTGLTDIFIPRTVNRILGNAFNGCSALTNVRYEGTEDEWNAISITATGNDSLTNAAIMYNTGSPVCGGNLTWELAENGLLTISGSGDMYDWESEENVPWHSLRSDITGVILEDEVTSIGNNAFNNCPSITEFVIGNGITSLENIWFRDYPSLTRVELGNGITSIDNDRFSDCSSLTEIVFGSGVTTIGDSAFRNCSSLTELVLSDSVTTIGNEAFRDCSSLSELVFGDSVTTIGESTFAGCIGLTELSIGKSVSYIGNFAFEGCYGLTTVFVPLSVKEIKDGAFAGCNEIYVTNYIGGEEEWNQINTEGGNDTLTQNINYYYGRSGNCGDDIRWCLNFEGELVISGTGSMTDWESAENVPWYSLKDEILSICFDGDINSIGSYAFYDCINISSADIPASVISIGNAAFYSCDDLSAVTLNDGIESIGNEAFSFCHKLESIEIPATVTSIGAYSFNSTGLKEINIPYGVTCIEEGTFFSCSSLTEISIPDTVISIGRDALHDCSSIESITIPASVTNIGEFALTGSCANGIRVAENNANYSSEAGILFDKNKTALIQYPAENANSSYTIPDTVKVIEPHAFLRCNNLSEITIADSVTKIRDEAFAECDGLLSVTIPDTVTEIEHGAFRHCRNLRDVRIGNGITTVRDNMFWGCISLTQVIFGNNIERIEYGAFSECEKLEGVTLPEGLTFIGERAFEYCKSLMNITIPDSVTELEPWIFRECTGLISVTIGDGVTTIPEGMFEMCESIASVTLPHALVYVGDNAFGCCENIKMIYYNGTNTEWRAIENHSGELTRLPGMYRKYFCWVSLYDNEGNFLYKAKNTMGEPIYACNIPMDENEELVKVYNDQELTDKFDLTTILNENISLYIQKIDGTKTLVSDEGELVEQQLMYTIKGMHMKEGSRVILALYTNGKFAGVQDAVYYHGDIIFKTEIEHTTAKVMVWDERGMRPVHRSENVQR